MSGSVKTFKENNKLMSFSIDDDKLLENPNFQELSGKHMEQNLEDYVGS